MGHYCTYSLINVTRYLWLPICNLITTFTSTLYITYRQAVCRGFHNNAFDWLSYEVNLINIKGTFNIDPLINIQRSIFSNSWSSFKILLLTTTPVHLVSLSTSTNLLPTGHFVTGISLLTIRQKLLNMANIFPHASVTSVPPIHLQPHDILCELTCTYTLPCWTVTHL